jgi:O-antigen/teichoic acid export membrane protein
VAAEPESVAMSDGREAHRRIARNTAYLTAAFVTQKLLSFLYFAYYSGSLGAVSTGQVFTAITFATVFGVFIDAGFSPVLIRETARKPEQAQRLLSSVLWFKGGFAIMAYLLLVISVNFTPYAPITRSLADIVGLAVVLESFTLTLYGVFRGFQDLKYEALGSVIFQVLVFIIGGLAIQAGHSILFLGIALVVGALANFLFAVFTLWRKHHLRFRLKIDNELIAPLIRTWLPFFIAAVLIRAYASVDVILLSLLRGEQSVGWYSVAYKLTFALQFLPLALNNSVFPAFSRAFVESREALRAIFQQSFKFLLLLAVPLTVGVFVFVEPILNLRWASYSQTPQALRVLILSLPLIFLNLILGSLLNASNRQRENTIHIAFTLLANIVLDIMLIPSMGHVGAAWASVISSAVFFFLSLRWVPQLTGMNYIQLSMMTLRSVLAVIPTALFFFWARETGWLDGASFFLRMVNLVLAGGVGVILYIGSAFITGGLEWRSVRQVIGAVLRRHA